MCKIFGHNIKLTILLKANRSMVDNTRKLVYGSSIFGKFMSNLNTKFQFRLLTFYNDKNEETPTDNENSMPNKNIPSKLDAESEIDYTTYFTIVIILIIIITTLLIFGRTKT